MPKAAVNSVLTNTDVKELHNVLVTSVCPYILSSTLHRQTHAGPTPLPDHSPFVASSIITHLPESSSNPLPNFLCIPLSFCFLWEWKFTHFWKGTGENGQALTLRLFSCGDSVSRLPEIYKNFYTLIPQSLWMSLSTDPDLQPCILMFSWFRTYKTTWGKTYLKAPWRSLWREVASHSSVLLPGLIFIAFLPMWTLKTVITSGIGNAHHCA